MSAATLTLVARGAAWRYLDTGIDPGVFWRANAFDDSAWRSGPAQLGYGDGDEATIVRYGSSASTKFITTYFRYSFTVANPANYHGLTLRLLRDDGAAVYLNETEIARSNLPAGTITQATRATTAVGGADEQAWLSFTVSPARLVAGTNVLAVEIHQSDPTSSDISFDLELTAASGASLTRGPYLQLGTPNSMAIRWRTDAATNSRVTYGPDPANLIWTTDDVVSTTEHQVTLTNLMPDTRYYYAVGSTSERLAGDGTYTFLTSPLPGATKPTRVWVIGDSGTGSSSAAAVRDSYTTFTGTRDTDLWLMLGDNAYNSGLDAEYQRGVFDMYAAMLRRSVLWPTLGNHDGLSADSTTGTGPYYDAFTLPRSGEAGGVASGTEAYYSFDYGAVHFVCLDSYDSSRSATGAMATWLRQDLASTNARWVVAYWHHPPYSKGSHNSDTEIELVEMRANINPILEAGGVDLVLAGHSHSYERSFLIDGHYGVSTTFSSAMKKDGGSGRGSSGTPYRKSSLGPAPHQGTVYAVAGVAANTGGGPLNHPAMFVSLNVLGSMVLDVNGDRLDARFIDVAGGVRDEFTMIKGQSGAAPQPPTGLTATAISTSTVDLRWSDADTLEEGFKVERATGGGAFAEVATLGANVTSYTDSGRSSSTTYSYRIRAFNSSGFSAYSAVAAATTPAPPPPPAQTVFIAAGSTWKYLDTGSNQGTAWRAVAFNDSSWRSGPAQLGYGDGDEATVVRYGSSLNRYITTYFRRSFTVADRAAFTALTLRVLRDDGAVVYLNGVEIFRTNMPGGTIGYSTRASSAVGGSDESRFFTAAVSPARLVNGTNVMAVEIHQSGPTSTDVSFNLDLTGK